MSAAPPPLRIGIAGYGVTAAVTVDDAASALLCLLEGWPDAPWRPNFADGAAVQAVCDAMGTSAASGRWVSVSEVLASTL